MKKIKENSYLINMHMSNDDIVAVHAWFIQLYTSLADIWVNLT